jgi:hypothetical protein
LSGSGTYYSWVGWPVSSWASLTISFSNQTVGVGTDPDTINLSSNPTGNGLTTFEVVTDTLKQGTLDDSLIDLKDGATWNLALDDITLSGEVNTLGIPVDLTLETSGSITSLVFDQTSGPTGTLLSYTFPSASYLTAPSGNISAGYNVNIQGEIDVGGLFTIDLGTLLNLSDTLNEALPLPLVNTMTLTELPAGDGVYPKDVEIHINTGLPTLSLPFSTTASISENTYGGNKNPYYKINATVDADAAVTLDGASMDLYDTIVGAIPEPATVAVLGLGGALFGLARRRRK